MSLSLREQLLKAGLVSEQQAAKAERDQRQKEHGTKRLPKRERQAGPSLQEAEARRAAADKAARDAELNRRKQEKAERKARFAEIRQLVEKHQVARVETDDYYNFQDGTNIKRVSVTPQLRERLVQGGLAIVRCEGRYAFVPSEVGQRIRGRVERALIHWNDPSVKPAEDDPYKDFVVPDDLMW